MGEWDSVALKTLCTLITKGTTPTTVGGRFTDQGIYFIKSESIGYDGSIDTTKFAFVDEETHAKQRRSQLAEGDVIYSIAGVHLGKCASVRKEHVPANTNQAVAIIRVNADKVSSRFVEYVLRNQSFVRQVLSGVAQSAQPNVNLTEIGNFRIPVPPHHEQIEIATLLGALDDKIELNRQTNVTLEALARALFKDWFVDFGPTRAKAEGRPPYLAPELWDLFPDALDEEDKPLGWEMRSIYDFANVVYGAPFASKLFNTEQAGLPLIRIRDLATHEPGVCTEERHPKGHLIEPGDIVVGMDGEFRLHVWKGPKSWLNQRVCHFEPLSGVPASFLVEALKEPLAYFERGKVGTTVIHLGKSDIDTFKLIYPGEKKLLAFSDLVEPLLEQCVTNALESRTLAQTRDLLLPKLMSGEIRLRDPENLVEKVA